MPVFRDSDTTAPDEGPITWHPLPVVPDNGHIPVPGDGSVPDPPTNGSTPPPPPAPAVPLPSGEIETPIHASVPLVYGRAPVKAQVYGRSESNWSINNQEQVWFGLCLGPIASIEFWYDDGVQLQAADFGVGNRGGYGAAPTSDTGSLAKTPFPGTVLGSIYKNDTGYNRTPLNPGAMVKGMLVYDPRQDSTNGGSGAQRLATPSTWSWSDNPALCMADFKMSARYGAAVPSTDIDWPSVATAADYCDATVSGAKRYTLNIALGAEKTVAELENTLGVHFGASWQFQAGKWNLIVFKAAAGSPVAIGPDEIVGSAKLTRNSSGFTAPNRITVEWLDAWGRAQQVSVKTAAVDAGAAIVDPGVFAIHGCNTEAQALRCAQVILDRTTYDMTLDVELMPAFLDLTIGDLLTLNDLSVAPLGTSFQVLSAGRTDRDTVQVRAQEYVAPSSSSSSPFTPGALTLYSGPPYTTAVYDTDEKYDPATDRTTTKKLLRHTMEFKFSSTAEEANAAALRFRVGAYGGSETFSALPAATEARIPIQGNLPVEHATYYKLATPFLTGTETTINIPEVPPNPGYYQLFDGSYPGIRVVMVVEGKNGSVSADQVVLNQGPSAVSSGSASPPGDTTVNSITVGLVAGVKLTPGRLFNIRTGR